MESIERGKAALISGIEADARGEEQAIIEDAERRAAEKRQYSVKKAESLLADARQKGTEQGDAAKRKTLSAMELEIKRRSLRVRDAVIRSIIDRVEKRFFSMIGTPEYRPVLFNWIVEAVIGLDVTSVEVNASPKELPLISDQLLAEIRDVVLQRTDKEVSLVISSAGPLKTQGIVVMSTDGRMAFNNQVKTRCRETNVPSKPRYTIRCFPRNKKTSYE